jgi:prepilin-type N-terminal cleavage/methylation domain-containing protein
MNKGFSLVEILIVVAILGIMAAIVIPEFQEHSEKAKESAAKDNLRILRDAIGRYAIEHDDVPPGYAANNASGAVHFNFFRLQLTQTEEYISEIPENPFNNLSTVKMVGNGTDFPDATEDFGWIYKPETKEIRIDKTGSDSEGKNFSEY